MIVMDNTMHQWLDVMIILLIASDREKNRKMTMVES